MSASTSSSNPSGRSHLGVALSLLALVAGAMSYVMVVSISNQIHPGHWSGWLHLRIDLGGSTGHTFSWTAGIIALVILSFAAVENFRKLFLITFIVFAAVELGWGHDLPHPLDYGGAMVLLLIGEAIMFLAFESHLRRRFGKEWRNKERLDR